MEKTAEEVTETAPAEGEAAPESEVATTAAEKSGQVVEAQGAGEPSAPRPTSEAPRPRRRGRGGFRRKVCLFCVDKIDSIDYKDTERLRRYVSDRGKIDPRRKTGTCAKHQRRLSIALKRARHLALLPYTPEHIRLSGFFPRG